MMTHRSHKESQKTCSDKSCFEGRNTYIIRGVSFEEYDGEKCDDIDVSNDVSKSVDATCVDVRGNLSTMPDTAMYSVREWMGRQVISTGAFFCSKILSPGKCIPL